MSEKMLVTQALDERDLLVKKINDKIRSSRMLSWFTINGSKRKNSTRPLHLPISRSWTSSHVFRPLMQQSSTLMPIPRSPHHMALILLRQLFHSVAG